MDPPNAEFPLPVAKQVAGIFAMEHTDLGTCAGDSDRVQNVGKLPDVIQSFNHESIGMDRRMISLVSRESG